MAMMIFYAIDLMHNDVKQCFCSSNVHCGSQVVMHEFNMASYFLEAEKINGRNADMCSDMAGPSISGSGDLLSIFR